MCLLVRCAALQEEFSALLPLYLTAEHFNRALPHMEPLLRLLAPERVSAAGCSSDSLVHTVDAMFSLTVIIYILCLILCCWCANVQLLA
jgi:hypothetical protein